MKRSTSLLACLAVAAMASPASAHFVWLGVAPDKNAVPAAHVWFGEGPEADSAELLPKIAHTKVWLAKPGESASLVKLHEESKGGLGAFVGEIKGAAPYRLHAFCDYGVFSRGDQTMLLQYHAKHLHMTSAEQLAGLARAQELALDVVPELTADGLRLQVLWQGKPAKESAVVVVGPDGKSVDLTTDADGYCTAKRQAGDYAFRARWTEDRAGERDGKSYKQVRHYSTLTFTAPAALPNAAR